MSKLLFVVGARPNFMKVAPVLEALKSYPQVKTVLVHTGQHYDASMSAVFFSQLNLRQPDFNLGVRAGTHALQTARIMKAVEPVLVKERPDCVVVAGDVNSTVACALVAAKLGIRVAHIEAGLRSYDWKMPEEINRVLTDRLSQYLFTSSPECELNLRREGIQHGRRDEIPREIHFVGNSMIDSLVKFAQIASKSEVLRRLGLTPKSYGVVTLHRPSNVDAPEDLARVARIVLDAARRKPVMFPIHPRTRKNFKLSAPRWFDRLDLQRNVRLIEPQGYVEFLKLQMDASFVLTDSGGVQEESTVLGVPCLTLRENTERPVTVALGSSTLIGKNEKLASRLLTKIERGTYKRSRRIPKWDGKAGLRIAKILSRV